MRYEGAMYRPPSEADALILQATVGCSWSHCTYCAMYRDRRYRVRDLEETLADIEAAGRSVAAQVHRVFVADGDALAMDMTHWEAILSACRNAFPDLQRVTTYATAMNLRDKSPADLARLRELGLRLLYIGPESGDDETLRRIAKGASFDDHMVAAKLAHEAGLKLSCIFLLGVGGTGRTREHAEASARLITAMDPEFLSLLTLTVIPGTPIAELADRGQFELPSVEGMLRELRTMVALAQPSASIFRTNHASNYLPLAGRLPRDRDRIVAEVDRALAGEIKLRPEWSRGL
jgi:radical SAM superfamily enzyme YgiQ (UPF0313 family)